MNDSDAIPIGVFDAVGIVTAPLPEVALINTAQTLPGNPSPADRKSRHSSRL